MSKKGKLSKEMIEKLIKLIKEGDKEAKLILWEEFKWRGIAYVKKMLKTRIMRGGAPLEEDEILSIVVMSFERALDKFRFESEISGKKQMSFGNWYMEILGWEFIDEYKRITGWEDIEGKSKVIKEERAEILRNRGRSYEAGLIYRVNLEVDLKEIMNFLEGKNIVYSFIVAKRLEGYKNREIAKMLDINCFQLKSRIQYIKNLMKARFGERTVKTFFG